MKYCQLWLMIWWYVIEEQKLYCISGRHTHLILFCFSSGGCIRKTACLQGRYSQAYKIYIWPSSNFHKLFLYFNILSKYMEEVSEIFSMVKFICFARFYFLSTSLTYWARKIQNSIHSDTNWKIWLKSGIYILVKQPIKKPLQVKFSSKKFHPTFFHGYI